MRTFHNIINPTILLFYTTLIVATMRCIFHFTNYYDCDLQLQWRHYLDSEGFINRLNELLTEKNELPNTTFISDWDLFQYSKYTLAQMFQKLFFAHVKDFQDDKTLYDQLIFDTQLNMDSDELVTNYLENLSTNQSQVPLYLSTKYFLYIDGNSVISKLKTKIRTIISLPLYKK